MIWAPRKWVHAIEYIVVEVSSYFLGMPSLISETRKLTALCRFFYSYRQRAREVCYINKKNQDKIRQIEVTQCYTR
jgi:hypothetical protein